MRWNACIEIMKQLTIFNSLKLLGFFMRVLHAFCHHSNIILIHLIDFYYWSLFWDSLLYCLAFCGNQLFEFYQNSSDWLPHDAGSGCRLSRSRLLTVLYLFFFYLLVLYFYIASSQVFFKCVSGKLFRWYLLILIFLVYREFFNSTSFYIYGFYSAFNCSFLFLELFNCSGRYSFYTFCLMHSLKKAVQQTDI